jgi:hypothetical protein
MRNIIVLISALFLAFDCVKPQSPQFVSVEELDLGPRRSRFNHVFQDTLVALGGRNGAFAIVDIPNRSVIRTGSVPTAQRVMRIGSSSNHLVVACTRGEVWIEEDTSWRLLRVASDSSVRSVVLWGGRWWAGVEDGAIWSTDSQLQEEWKLEHSGTMAIYAIAATADYLVAVGEASTLHYRSRSVEDFTSLVEPTIQSRFGCVAIVGDTIVIGGSEGRMHRYIISTGAWNTTIVAENQNSDAVAAINDVLERVGQLRSLSVTKSGMLVASGVSMHEGTSEMSRPFAFVSSNRGETWVQYRSPGPIIRGNIVDVSTLILDASVVVGDSAVYGIAYNQEFAMSVRTSLVRKENWSVDWLIPSGYNSVFVNDSIVVPDRWHRRNIIALTGGRGFIVHEEQLPLPLFEMYFPNPSHRAAFYRDVDGRLRRSEVIALPQLSSSIYLSDGLFWAIDSRYQLLYSDSTLTEWLPYEIPDTDGVLTISETRGRIFVSPYKLVDFGDFGDVPNVGLMTIRRGVGEYIIPRPIGSAVQHIQSTAIDQSGDLHVTVNLLENPDVGQETRSLLIRTPFNMDDAVLLPPLPLNERVCRYPIGVNGGIHSWIFVRDSTNGIKRVLLQRLVLRDSGWIPEGFVTMDNGIQIDSVRWSFPSNTIFILDSFMILNSPFSVSFDGGRSFRRIRSEKAGVVPDFVSSQPGRTYVSGGDNVLGFVDVGIMTSVDGIHQEPHIAPVQNQQCPCIVHSTDILGRTVDVFVVEDFEKEIAAKVSPRPLFLTIIDSYGAVTRRVIGHN